jgi:hypothetical protein
MSNTVDANATGDQLLAFGALLGRSGKIIESEISGTSMGSTLPSGCRIRICPLPTAEYQPGQVVAFVAGEAIYAHRIVHRSHEGVLTRGDSHSWCDLPVPSRAILGVVTEYLCDGEWRPLDASAAFNRERPRGIRTLEILLRVCMQIDIRLAVRTSRSLIRLARWRRLVASHIRNP